MTTLQAIILENLGSQMSLEQQLQFLILQEFVYEEEPHHHVHELPATPAPMPEEQRVLPAAERIEAMINRSYIKRRSG